MELVGGYRNVLHFEHEAIMKRYLQNECSVFDIYRGVCADLGCCCSSK